jgi:hypothetical protein
MRRRRFRTWAKWGFALAAVVAASVAVASRFVGLRDIRSANHGAGLRVIDVSGGLLWVQHFDQWSLRDTLEDPGWRVFSSNYWNWGLGLEASRPNSGWDWRCGTLWSIDQTSREVGISLLYPVLLTTLPAAFLWYKDRRRFGPHACKGCGYDRRGLPAEGPCPECGTTPARG